MVVVEVNDRRAVRPQRSPEVARSNRRTSLIRDSQALITVHFKFGLAVQLSVVVVVALCDRSPTLIRLLQAQWLCRVEALSRTACPLPNLVSQFTVKALVTKIRVHSRHVVCAQTTKLKSDLVSPNGIARGSFRADRSPRQTLATAVT